MLVQKDAPIRFRIHKANAGEGDYDLSGATFSVTPVDAEGEPLITEATDAAGDVDLSNLALAVDTDYTIAETKAPDGFKLDADAVTVHIDADGTVALSGEAPASYTLDAADDGAFVLTCSDEPYALQLLDDAGGSVKAGDEGTALVVTDQRVVENGTARTGDGLPIGAAAGLLSAAALALFAHLTNRRKEEA